MRGWARGRTVLVYSAAHFAVDFACAFLMVYITLAQGRFPLMFVLYNFCAFALQLPLGLLADRLNRNAALAAAGCTLVAGAFVPALAPPAAVLLAGLGNALFHIGGGVEVLNLSKKDGRLLGVFVSPGALGLYLGTLLGKGRSLSAWVVAGGLAMFALLVLANLALARRDKGKEPGSLPNEPFRLPTLRGGGMAAVLCLLLVVCLRSYLGLVMAFPWKTQGHWGLALIGAVVIGKCAGGFLAARVGTMRASLLSLGLASVLFPMATWPVAGVAAVLLFNMTMPITLWALARIFENAKGFAFGLLCFGLFLGYLPVVFGVAAVSFGWGYALVALSSLPLMWLGLRKAAP